MLEQGRSPSEKKNEVQTSFANSHSIFQKNIDRKDETLVYGVELTPGKKNKMSTDELNKQNGQKSLRPCSVGSQGLLHGPITEKPRKIMKQRPTSHYQVGARTGFNSRTNKQGLLGNVGQTVDSGVSLRSMGRQKHLKNNQTLQSDIITMRDEAKLACDGSLGDQEIEELAE